MPRILTEEEPDEQHGISIEIDDDTAEEWLRGDLENAQKWVAEVKIENEKRLQAALKEERELRLELEEFLRDRD